MYTGLRVVCPPDYIEILIAEISDVGFDGFEETDTGFEAFVEGDGYDQEALNEIWARYTPFVSITHVISKVEKRNWNEEWERNFSPLVVEDKCLVRAHFHPGNSNYPLEIIITPKMSFGTGHHQTTYMMLKAQMETDHKNKRVIDAGCGTGILAIMAVKLGAKDVIAYDIDEWSIDNGKENAETNQCHDILFYQGGVDQLVTTEPVDIILANINKNVLVEDIPVWSTLLKSGGILIVSGFYSKDSKSILASAGTFEEISRDSKADWVCLILKKP